MKTFSTSGTGNQQTLSEIESDKVPIYDSVADAEADLANLSVGQLVATKDTGTELSQPVDVVQSGNLHAVTSNAVAEAIACVEVSSSDTDWLIQKLGNGKYIATGWNKSSGTYSSGSNPIQFSIPTGYKLSKVVNGNAFAQGNVTNVTQAIHSINDYGIRMYVANGDYSIGDMRIQCILVDD